ncbi:division/cell wall cluster transcriptional repressor MraZ [Acetatifactor aquisgranensis]|uniref:division/cell wall cluster transcriptional repressor MraZ n=1 Tax=Acetatifactor aquisgranensis TaxID=2941233 RepID=UPI00203BCC43|nr:division/cell wall cluster transcriptional repressor MraZ [Acetatifactor aquisgranensis]MCI8543256.1 division/cell wall cluster transcriptional repressor MraZ [Lachnospiraceae bacterium]
MFMGRYNHTIDPKGRLSIPSKYREVLGDEFVVSKGMDGCLFVYANEEWKVFEEKLASLPLINPEARQFARFFLSGAQSVTVDKQGRILMPQDLRDFAGLEKDVVLAGMGGRIEIWSLERWNANSESVDIGAISQGMMNLGLTI